MPFTQKQTESFTDAVTTFTCSLYDAVKWIKNNLYPEDVFEESELGGWARFNGFIKE